MTAFKTLLWSILVPGTVAVLIPYWLLSSGWASFALRLGAWRFLGLPPMLLGALIYCWCAWDFTFAGKGTPAPFDPPQELVVKGPYRLVRNPMYVFVLLAIIGAAIFFENAVLLVYAALVFTFFHLWVVMYEEPTLHRKFGTAYARYCAAVARWLPRFN